MGHSLILPEPPGVNQWKTPARGPRGLYMVKTVQFRRFEGATQIAWARQMPRGAPPIKGPVALTMRWYRSRRIGDLDGRFKSLCDALNGLAYVDDAQIAELHGYRYEDRENPRVEVDFTELWTPGD